MNHPSESSTRTRKFVDDQDWNLYVRIQARPTEIYFDSYASLPQHVVDSLLNLRSQGFVKFDPIECDGRGHVIKVTPRLEGEAPGKLDAPEQWRAWEAMTRAS